MRECRESSPARAGSPYNARVGDRIAGLVGDQVEPAVSARNPDPEANAGCNILTSQRDPPPRMRAQSFAAAARVINHPRRRLRGVTRPDIINSRMAAWHDAAPGTTLLRAA